MARGPNRPSPAVSLLPVDVHCSGRAARWIRGHQRIAYAALFEASSEAIKTLVADPKYVGAAKTGFFGVLHTWGRTLEYHPHVHYVVPGGGLSADGTQWLPSHAHFLVPVHALSILFRAKFRDALDRAGVLAQVDPAVWRQDWVVHSQAVGDGRASLKYLAPYVFRVAISDRRIVSCDNGKVTYSYRKSGSNRWRKMTVDGSEFVRRFLQHVLPTGFQKVRHYGFLSPNSRVSLEMVRWLIALYHGLVFALRGHDPQEVPVRPRFRCAVLRRTDDRRRFRACTPNPFPSIPARQCSEPVDTRGPSPTTSPSRRTSRVRAHRTQPGPSHSLWRIHALLSRSIEPLSVLDRPSRRPFAPPTPPRLTLRDDPSPNRFPIQRVGRRPRAS